LSPAMPGGAKRQSLPTAGSSTTFERADCAWKFNSSGLPGVIAWSKMAAAVERAILSPFAQYSWRSAMNRFVSLSLGFLCLIVLLPAVVRAADESAPAMTEEQKDNVIKPEDAKNNVGKEVIVEFVVVGGRTLEDKGIGFLNSSTDPNDPDGFTAFITKTGMNKFKDEAKIDDPADHFMNKKIRVSGKIKKYKDKPEIEVKSPDQVKMIEEETKPEGKAEEEKKM
jgi:hypothetical protein